MRKRYSGRYDRKAECAGGKRIVSVKDDNVFSLPFKQPYGSLAAHSAA
jgi:hypothetical protein